jgi:hypothetical protein
LYSLPDELILLILRFISSPSPSSSSNDPTRHLLSLSSTSRLLNDLTRPFLYAVVHLTSLDTADQLLSTLESPRTTANEWGALVRSLSVQGRVFAKGYGVRVARLLKAATEVQRVEVVSADDLRMKHFTGTGGASSRPSPPSYTLTHILTHP